LRPACWMSGTSVSPNAWNFSADSQTSSTHRPSGVAPTTWERQPPPGQSAQRAQRLAVVQLLADLVVLLGGSAGKADFPYGLVWPS
jgi:hypothetical protein